MASRGSFGLGAVGGRPVPGHLGISGICEVLSVRSITAVPSGNFGIRRPSWRRRGEGGREREGGKEEECETQVSAVGGGRGEAERKGQEVERWG